MPFAERQMWSLPVIGVAGRQVKRYHLSVAPPLPGDEAVDAANEYLPRLLPPLEPDTPGAAFTVLHQGEDAIWFGAYAWVAQSIVHCRQAAATFASPTAFHELPERWIGCVWELPALEYERAAWVRHILAPDAPDLDGYLADTRPDGPAGG